MNFLREMHCCGYESSYWSKIAVQILFLQSTRAVSKGKIFNLCASSFLKWECNPVTFPVVSWLGEVISAHTEDHLYSNHCCRHWECGRASNMLPSLIKLIFYCKVWGEKETHSGMHRNLLCLDKILWLPFLENWELCSFPLNLNGSVIPSHI